MTPNNVCLPFEEPESTCHSKKTACIRYDSLVAHDNQSSLCLMSILAREGAQSLGSFTRARLFLLLKVQLLNSSTSPRRTGEETAATNSWKSPFTQRCGPGTDRQDWYLFYL